MYKPISNYGVIGDLHTVALIGSDGGIDWLCLTFIDSPQVFSGLSWMTGKGDHSLSIPLKTGNPVLNIYLRPTSLQQLSEQDPE